MSARIRAVIFDMDGVLIDAREWHYEALNRALALFGMEISRYDHLVTYDGLPTRKKLEMLSHERGLPAELHEFINELKQRHTIEIIHAKCKPTYAHQYTLSRLRQMGYRMAVCSNSIRDTVDLMLRKAELLGYLDFYLSNQDVSQAKPHPEIYTKAAERMQVAPDECLVIEDNRNGALAATRAGTHLMQVLGPAEVTFEAILRQLQEVDQSSK